MGVSPWRRLLIANELNELQSKKHVKSETILLVFLLITEGFGFRYYSQMEPNLTRTKSQTPENYPLMFFVTTILIYTFGTLDYLFQMILAIWWPPDYVNFYDLCSVANISVVMFNDE